MLAEMVYLVVIEGSCKEEILEEVKKAPDMLRYALWMKIRGLVVSMVRKAVQTGWDGLMTQAKELSSKVEPKIMEVLEKVFEVQEKVKQKILSESFSMQSLTLGDWIFKICQ